MVTKENAVTRRKPRGDSSSKLNRKRPFVCKSELQ